MTATPTHTARSHPPVRFRRPATVVLVGAGPRGISVLERLVANAAQYDHPHPVAIHVVDPHAPGPGRIWRAEQSPLLWMNSTTADVTMFSDESVAMDGPLGPGPSLWQWIDTVGRYLPDGDPVGEEARRLGPQSFASRVLQSRYLTWVWDRVVAAAPPHVQIHVHRARAVDVEPAGDDVPEGRDRVRLDDGTVLDADVLVLAQGHLDVALTPQERAFEDFAAAHDSLYLPTGYTADLGLELDLLAPGQDVLVRGLGLALVDLAVLVAEGRGGRFERVEGRLRYLPSGLEPHLIAGSRRGVPYRSKLGYVGPLSRPQVPRFLTPDAVRARTGGAPVTDFAADVWPLVVKDLGFAHYAELFASHPQRVLGTWEAFEAAYSRVDVTSKHHRALVASAVPDPLDRFDVDRLDRPLADLHVDSVAALQPVVREHVRGDLRRRADPVHSADAAVFVALLFTYGALAGLAAEGLLSHRVLVEDVELRWHGFFSYVASGPPGPRLEELVALSEAGILTFFGADTVVESDTSTGEFVARSSSHDEVVRARVLVEARLPAPSVTESLDPLIRHLAERGELVDERDRDERGDVTSGKVKARAADQRLVHADGTVSHRRFAVGPWVSGGAATAAFARPGIGAGFFRQNDAVARSVLTLLSTVPA
jgi:uncharacterized NAD(P)/FAD-binding protein YdhS